VGWPSVCASKTNTKLIGTAPDIIIPFPLKTASSKLDEFVIVAVLSQGPLPFSFKLWSIGDKW
jgi:hypothetical protein